MRSLLPTSHKDLAALLGEKLKVNPLVLSLFAVSPADALDYIGIKNSDRLLNMRRATSVEDCSQIMGIIEAFRIGRTTLDTSQQITPVDAIDPLLTALVLARPETAPAISPAPERAIEAVHPAPDITLSVARTTLILVTGQALTLEFQIDHDKQKGVGAYGVLHDRSCRGARCHHKR
jgi:hypothetical protein